MIFGSSDIIEKNKDMLIHMFFHILDHDFRNGFYSNKSSMHDMAGCGFTYEDYVILSKQYYDTKPEGLNYSQGQQYYQKLLNDYFDNIVVEKFKSVYGVFIDKKTHLLTDLIEVLEKSHPNRDWERENIFILKTLDYRLEKEEEEIRALQERKIEEKTANNVVKFPVRRKLTPEEIKNGFNEFLMINSLGMNWEEARVLAQSNFDKKMQGKAFEPYVPETNKSKPKI